MGKDVKFARVPIHEVTYKDLKELPTGASVLKHFNVKEPGTVSIDTSFPGIRGGLLQTRAPVYVAKALTATQSYVQFKKKC